MQPSALVTGLFVALIIAVVCTFLVAVWRAGRPLEETSTRSAIATAIAATLVLLVGGGSFVLASRGVLRDFSSTPPAFLKALLPIMALTTGYALFRCGHRLSRGISLPALLAFQGFRVAVELILFELHREGVIPVQMTFEGRNFDILAGLTGPLMAWLYATGRVSRRGVLVWNIAGLALLANIVVTAILSMPTPFRVFREGVPNTIITEVPYVWLPAILVQAALVTHLLIFRRLTDEEKRAR